VVESPRIAAEMIDNQKVALYIDPAYFPFFRFMSENSLMVKIRAKPIKENTTTPVKNKT
jgi:hypothetical protein